MKIELGQNHKNKTVRLVRRLLLFFILALLISGITAIPIERELSFLLNVIPPSTRLHFSLEKVLSAYKNVYNDSAFLLYGYDWLAFAHFILAILFIGPYRDPVKNIWVIEFGLIACTLIVPLAFIAGHFREIPIGWRLIDCSFGTFGFLTLWICYSKTKRLILQNHSINKYGNYRSKSLVQGQSSD